MPAVTPVPSADLVEYARLFHHTSYTHALTILSSRFVKGSDTHKHANFFASKKYRNKDPCLPCSRQVCLEFEWVGTQAVLDSWPNDGEPLNTSMVRPILFHIVTQDPKNWSDWNIASRGYWQSVVYPGSQGLILRGCTFLDAPVAPKSLGCLQKLIGMKSDISEDFLKVEKIKMWTHRQIGTKFQV